MSGTVDAAAHRSATFRLHTPSAALIAWSVVSGACAATLVGLGIMSLFEFGWDYGMHGALGVLSASIPFVAAFVLPWVAHLRSRTIRWVRVTREHGLVLSDGRAISWDRVYRAERRERMIVVHATSTDPVELPGVRGADRLLAMIRGHARGEAPPE